MAYAEINTTNPTITPTLGATKVSNGGFDSDVIGWTGNNANLSSVAGGQAGNCLQVDATGAFGDARQTLAALTVGEYYQYELYEKNGTAAGLVRWGINATGSEYANRAINGTWIQMRTIARVTSATSNITLYMNSGTFPQNTLYDTVSVKPLTDTTLLLGDIGRKVGTFICHPTVAQYSIAGMDFDRLDANNLFRMELKRNADTTATTTARVMKRLAGTWSEVVSGAVTYSAAAEFKTIISGTTLQLWYNGTQVGTDQTVDYSALGTEVFGFNTLAGNTLGACTTNP